MGSGLNVYLIDLEATRALVGSWNEKLLEKIRDRFGDEISPKEYADMAAVIHGGPFEDDDESEEGDPRYVHAYERLCSLTGTRLLNSSFSPLRAGWLAAVDEGLGSLNVTAVSVEAFDYDDLPEDLPSAERPGTGNWTAHEIKKALQQYEATVAATRVPALEPEVAAAVEQCVGWMRAAKAKRGLGIIGFVS